MGHKKWWDIVSKKRSNGLEKLGIGGKTRRKRVGSANYWYARGASCIALGSVAITLGAAIKSVAMSPGLAIGYRDLSTIYLILGVVMFVAGLFIIQGAYNIEIESGKRPVFLSRKELWDTNKYLFIGILLLISWGILTAFFCLWFLFL